MYKISRTVLSLLMLVVLFSNCRKKAFDEYYGRPDNLPAPIYQQLQTKGNFKHFLAAIDKAGYKNTLSAAGYWTLFAPHDSAFNVYFAANGINGIEQMDSATCRRLVTYSLVYNAFKVERLDDYQSNTGWVPASAFKRRTANYTYVYDGTDTAGRPIKVIASNRNGTAYADNDNNNKYIPYFVSEFMQAKNLSATDYNYFYPNTPYTGFNVVDAVVTERDIAAENGIIHVVNKVITVLPSIDQYLGSKPEYSLFKSLFDQFLVSYILNPAITQRYRNTTGNAVDVFTKVYSAANGTLAYSLNNENHLGFLNEGQMESYTIFAPTNAVLQQYINSVLLENYPPNSTLKDVNINIVYDFINAHLWQKAVWPTKFNSTFNFLNEPARFNTTSDIVDKKILSNGFFYGTNKVQEANVFTSVYGRAYLDPKYSMMNKLLDFELKSSVSDVSRFYTMFMISNDMWNAAGFYADPTVSNNSQEQWRFTPPAGSTASPATGASARNRMLRILNLHVIPHTLSSGVLNNLSGEGAAMSIGGEYIGFKNNAVFASGNVESNNTVQVLSSKTSRNGRVYYINRMLEISDSQIGAHIEYLGAPATSPYNYFWQFLRSSALWNNTTKEIAGISFGTFYTLFIPDNAAIMNAVRDGVLPGNRTTGVPNFNAGTQTNLEKEAVNRFLHYHFLDKRSIAADGEESGSFSTVLKNNLGDPTSIFVNNNVGNIQLTDMHNRTARVISAPSTYIGNRIVIHLINNYLNYSF